MISTICCYNNDILFEQLKKSLQNQTVDYELIPVNNNQNRFTSAADALNYGALKSTSKILVFIHQDIIISNPLFFDLLEKQIKSRTSIGDIVGVAGAKYPFQRNISNMQHGESNYNLAGTEITDITECDTVDECLFAMRRETWENYKFSPNHCPGWHLYAVDACINAKKNGHKVYVSNIDGVTHLSKGTVRIDYYNALMDLAKIYRKDVKTIWTTCGKVRTSNAYRVYFRTRKKIGHVLKKV